MITMDEKKAFLRSLGKVMDEFEGRVVGSMNLKFVGSGPDGSDELVKLNFPDYARIGSIPSPFKR